MRAPCSTTTIDVSQRWTATQFFNEPMDEKRVIVQSELSLSNDSQSDTATLNRTWSERRICGVDTERTLTTTETRVMNRIVWSDFWFDLTTTRKVLLYVVWRSSAVSVLEAMKIEDVKIVDHVTKYWMPTVNDISHVCGTGWSKSKPLYRNITTHWIILKTANYITFFCVKFKYQRNSSL